MRHIINGINSSFLTQFWLLQKVYGNLDPCFIKTRYSKEGYLEIYFNEIFHETGNVGKAHITCGSFILRALFWLREAHRQRRTWVDDFDG